MTAFQSWCTLTDPAPWAALGWISLRIINPHYHHHHHHHHHYHEIIGTAHKKPTVYWYGGHHICYVMYFITPHAQRSCLSNFDIYSRISQPVDFISFVNYLNLWRTCFQDFSRFIISFSYKKAHAFLESIQRNVLIPTLKPHTVY